MVHQRASRLLLFMACLLVLSITAPNAFAQTLQHPEGSRQLTKLGTISHSAFVYYRAGVRRAPDPALKPFAKLRLKTSESTDERVLILEDIRGVDGHMWTRVRLPIRPNGSTGWVRRAALSNYRASKLWLRINRRERVLRLFKGRRLLFRAPAGLGRSIWPTPKGNFLIRSRLQGFDRNPIYGPLVFGTSARSARSLSDWPGGGIIGIHGTNQPSLIPGYVSHGCIRLTNRKILRLGKLLRVGTPLTIR